MGNYISIVRNVNEALYEALNLALLCPENWRQVAPRGQPTLEWDGVFITEYNRPRERVLFSSLRDANPFFHFFESLWILAGRRDVAFLKYFNSNIANYSDDGEFFHAPYGYRLRSMFGVDQITTAIDMLRKDNTTRQVVMSIWNPEVDLAAVSKDIPCNDTIFLKVRDSALNMTVACRSNDIIWGAYGANAVQFSVLQEFIARAVEVDVGTYTQISDSFHFYTENEVYKRLIGSNLYKTVMEPDLYRRGGLARPVRSMIMEPRDYAIWLGRLSWLIDDLHEGKSVTDTGEIFFDGVVLPLWRAYKAYKENEFNLALAHADECIATDWAIACYSWLERRRDARNAKSQEAKSA